MGPAHQRHRRPALLSWPTRQPLPSPSIRPAAHARRTSRAPIGFRPLPAGRRLPVGRDPPAHAPLPPRVSHIARPPPLRFLLPPAPLKRAPCRCRPKFSPPTPRFPPLCTDVAPHPPPSPPPRATGPPRRSPEPSRPRRRLSPLRRHHRSNPSCRATARVSPASTPSAWRHPGAPPVLTGSTSPPASPHHVGMRASCAR
jgi:hypothetical protein